MPNWCTNFVDVTGSNARRFMEMNKGRIAQYSDMERERTEYVGFTFNAAVPVPQDVLNAGYNRTGYDWQNANWGTKWDVNDDEIQWCSDENDPDYIAIMFDTAWGPPIEWFQEVAPRFLDLRISLSYYELGMCFAGKITYENGILVGEETYDDGKDPIGFAKFMADEFEMDMEVAEEDETE